MTGKRPEALIKKEKLIVMICLCFAFLCFAGCGGGISSSAGNSVKVNGESASYDSDIYEPGAIDAASAEEAPVEDIPAEGKVASNRKLIRTVTLDAETENFDKLIQTVEARVNSLGGYIENMNVQNGNDYYDNMTKSATMAIRVPKDRLDDFVSEVAEQSNIIRKQESAEDITLDYVDTESRKKVLSAEQERLLAFLQEAQSIEEIIALEERLSEVRYELELMESQLRTYDNMVDYSTVYLSIEEVKVLTPVTELTAWERMSSGFITSIEDIGRGIRNFIVELVIHLPYLILWAVILLCVFLLGRFIIKRNRKKAPDRKYGVYGATVYQGGIKEQMAQSVRNNDDRQNGQNISSGHTSPGTANGGQNMPDNQMPHEKEESGK